jgi:hypothetical protein
VAIDPRDQLWEATFETYYDTYFHELLEDTLINRWQRFDEATKVLVALTASGSAVSGWALWTNPGFKTIWTVLAGIAAVLAIVHATLGVPARLKDHGEIKRLFASLRTDLETFRYRMRIDPNFPIAEFTEQFMDHRTRFSNGVQLLKSDILRTNRLADRVRDQLNLQLADEIIQ